MTIVIERQMDKPLISLEPHDLWAGLYWKFKRVVWTRSWQLNLYICPVPMLLVAFRIQKLPEGESHE